MGFMGASAVATKPIGDMKYMDWNKAKEEENELREYERLKKKFENSPEIGTNFK
jgi:hypothetical protein